MSAVISFLSESVVESLKGAYKLRRSFQLLHKVYDMIVSVEGSNQTQISNGTTKVGSLLGRVWSPEKLSGDSDEEFVDACNDVDNFAGTAALKHSVEVAISEEKPHSVPVRSSSHSTDARSLSHSSYSPALDRRTSIATISTFHDIPDLPEIDATLVDHTVYSATLMALGAIMLLISLLPPSLSRLLSIIGFRGSRSQALSMLWKVSSQIGPFSALGTFVLGSYYGNIVQNSDIVSDEFISRNTKTGATLERLHISIVRVRKRYPESALWAVEEVCILVCHYLLQARMESIKGNLEVVVDRLSNLDVNTQMPQIESLVIYEAALYTILAF